VLAGFQPFMKLALLRNVAFKSPPLALSPPPTLLLFEDEEVASTMVVTTAIESESDTQRRDEIV
jgi:hypothetical protein